jgi:hypothetical protein
MDSQRFDTLAKTLSATGTRRGVLAALLSGALSLRGLSQPAVLHQDLRADPARQGEALPLPAPGPALHPEPQLLSGGRPRPGL